MTLRKITADIQSEQKENKKPVKLHSISNISSQKLRSKKVILLLLSFVGMRIEKKNRCAFQHWPICIFNFY